MFLMRMSIAGWLATCTALFAASPAGAQEMYLSHNPPYVIQNSDHPGIMLETVQAMTKLLNITVPVKIMEWPEAQKRVREGKNLIIFPFARTPEREANYVWLQKFWDTDVSFVGPAGSKPVDTYEAASALKGVGVIDGSPGMSALKARDFKNLKVYASAVKLTEGIAKGEVEAGFSAEIELRYAWRVAAYPGLPVVGKSQIKLAQYIAVSKDSPAINAVDWNQAFDVVQQDGTFDGLYETYFGKK